MCFDTNWPTLHHSRYIVTAPDVSCPLFVCVCLCLIVISVSRASRQCNRYYCGSTWWAAECTRTSCDNGMIFSDGTQKLCKQEHTHTHTRTHTHSSFSLCSCCSCSGAMKVYGSEFAGDNVFSMLIEAFFAAQQLMCQLPTGGFYFKRPFSFHRRFNSCYICLSFLSKLSLRSRFAFVFPFQTGLCFLLRWREFTSPAMPSVFRCCLNRIGLTFFFPFFLFFFLSSTRIARNSPLSPCGDGIITSKAHRRGWRWSISE